MDMQRICRGCWERIWPIDALIHCGDVEGEEDYIAELAECPSYIVAGNNDYFSVLDREMEFELGGSRYFLRTDIIMGYRWELK